MNTLHTCAHINIQTVKYKLYLCTFVQFTTYSHALLPYKHSLKKKNLTIVHPSTRVLTRKCPYTLKVETTSRTPSSLVQNPGGPNHISHAFVYSRDKIPPSNCASLYGYSHYFLLIVLVSYFAI